MAKIQELYDRGSAEVIYPQTVSKAVICPDGRDLEIRLQTERDAINAELKKKTDTSELETKQDSLTSTADIIVDGTQLSLSEQAKRAVFNDMWDSAWGGYGKYDPVNAPDPQHPYMGNEIWMTYEEAAAIYQRSYAQNLSSLENVYKGYRLPTVLPLRIPTHEVKGTGVFQSASGITRVSIIGPQYGTVINLSEASSMFANCTSLEEVVCNTHILHAAYHSVPPADIFYNCIKLKEIRFYCDKVGFDIHWSPLLSLASVQSFIPPKAVPNGATITVHPDVYAKLTGDTTNEAAAALTDEEATAWQQVLADAVEKNISFATI